MISFNPLNLKFISAITMISILSACGGGGGGSDSGTDSNVGFNSNTNAKPQTSSIDNIGGAISSATSSQQSSKSVAPKSSSSANSSKASTVDLSAPSKPANFKVQTVQFDRVVLTWEPSTDNSSSIFYKIYRNQIQIETIRTGDTLYYDFDVAPGKSYTYSISAGDEADNWSELSEISAKTPDISSNSSAQNSSVSSSKSASNSSASSKSSAGADTISPIAPDQVIKINAYSTQVDISWTAATDNVDVIAYKIYRDSVLIKTVTADILSYSDKSVVSDISYWYGVSAGDAAGNWSTQKLLNVHTPAELVVGSATLKWLPPTERENQAVLPAAEIGGYEIRYKTILENNYHYKLVSSQLNQTTITGLTGYYSFEIATYDINGLYSNFTNITPQ